MSTGQACAVPHLVTDPERMPAARYYSEEFFKLECEHVWPRIWQMACRLEMIPEVGDWVEYSNLGHSVIVVRTSDGVKASLIEPRESFSLSALGRRNRILDPAIGMV